MTEPRKARPLDKSLYGMTPSGKDPTAHAGIVSKPTALGLRRRWQTQRGPLLTEPRRWADRKADGGKRPLIGINCDVKAQGTTEFCFVPDRYLLCLDAAGAEVVILTPYGGFTWPLHLLNGLLLIGGGDLDPRHDGFELHPSQRLMHPRREAFDRGLVAEARQRQIPLLAIGAGMQTLNVVLGGTLYYHLPEEFPQALPHYDAADPEHGHPVYVREGSLLAKCYPEQMLAHVRSRHHQAVDDVAPGFATTAWAEPGIVEAIESVTPGWAAIGVQWHPEVVEALETDRLLFAEFVEIARRFSTEK